ncbi:MAG: SGNH/GDSL hydrolase family protein [Armatimonadota bacterium]
MQTISAAKVIISGDSEITVQAGTYTIDGNAHRVNTSQNLRLTRPQRVTVQNEKAVIPTDAGANAPFWARGYTPGWLAPGGIAAYQGLRSQSIKLKSADGSVPYARGLDFDTDPTWGTIWRTPNSSMVDGATSLLTYTYNQCRIDSIVIDAQGIARVIEGKTGVWEVMPPETPKGDTLIARIWWHGDAQKLTEEQLYNVTATKMPVQKGNPLAATYTPKVLAKLQNGGTVNITFWGDSVTDGGSATEGMGFQHQFIRMLKKAFPKANINYATNAWGGRTTHAFLTEPSGSAYNFKEQILSKKPDLVVSEFVNDTGLPMDMIEKDYAQIQQDFAANGIEWLIMTPHFTTFEVMSGNTWRISKEARPVVLYLRKYAKPGIGVADAAARYEHFDSEGIPFASFMVNSINHPNNWGHQVFAEVLLNYFTGK